METPFRVDLGALKSRPKDDHSATLEKVERAGEEIGFIARPFGEAEAPKRGRSPSPRTGQIHAKVMPDVAAAIAAEARARGVQQGVILEEAWALYLTLKE